MSLANLERFRRHQRQLLTLSRCGRNTTSFYRQQALQTQRILERQRKWIELGATLNWRPAPSRN